MKIAEQPIETTSTNRRGFLRTSATVAGTALIGALDVGRFAHAAESSTIKLGLIGCGGRGTGAAGDALTGDPGTKLWAVADIFAGQDRDRHQDADCRCSRTGFRFPRERQFTGLNGYRGVIENCDVVLIACASRFHPEYALAAVQAKKHVFVEKPAGVDVAGIRKILEADELSKKNGTGVLAGVTYRYHLGRREAVQRMQAGEIGDIVAIQCDLPARTLPVDRAPAGMERDGVPVPQLVSLHVALAATTSPSRSSTISTRPCGRSAT